MKWCSAILVELLIIMSINSDKNGAKYMIRRRGKISKNMDKHAHKICYKYWEIVKFRSLSSLPTHIF